jgi:hypothetical protein
MGIAFRWPPLQLPAGCVSRETLARNPPIHRHNAQAFIYVLEGSVVMQVKGGKTEFAPSTMISSFLEVVSHLSD